MTSQRGQQELRPTASGARDDNFLNSTFEICGEDDFLIVSVKMYKFFMAHGKDGLEAKQLYDHLLFASRVQGTKAVRANQSYIKNGLGWGRDKVKKAKAFLSAAGLIGYAQIKDDSGQFKDQRIILKNSWNTESLLAWIEKKNSRNTEENTGGLKTSPPVENEETAKTAGGLDSSPVEDMVSPEEETPPDSRWTGLPEGGQTRPPVSDPNYKGIIKKERGGYNSKVITTGNREDEAEQSPDSEPPPNSKSEQKRGLFSEVQEKIRVIIGPSFKLSGKSRDMIRDLHELTSSEYVLQIIDQLTSEKRERVNPWLNRYANQDLQERLDWGIRTQAAKQQKTQKHQVFCPCCNTVFTGSNTACSICGFDKCDIDDPLKIKDHIRWLDTKDQVSPFSFSDESIQIKILHSLKEYSAIIHMYDLEDHLIIEPGLKPGRDPVMKIWNEIQKKAEHKSRHSQGIFWSIGLMKLRTHIDAIEKLPEEAFFPKQKDLFDEAM